MSRASGPSTALVLALAASAALTGCAPGAAEGVPAAARRGPVTASANPNTPDLIAARAAAGLPDCEPPVSGAEPALYGLPDVVLPCLGSDRSVNLAHLRGKPLVVNLWAEWCPPCREEAPALAEFARRAEGRVAVLGIDYTDPRPDRAIAFARDAGWNYPHLVDSAGVLKSRLAVPGIPVTLVVAPDGRVVYRRTGPVASADELAGIVTEHLGVTT
nr:TlpA family protein disulfide reductase [Propionibacterium sp.]